MADKKVRVKVVSPFILTTNDGGTIPFAVGTHDVDQDVADHWFVKAHSDNAPPFELKAGTKAFADAQVADQALRQRVEDARRVAVADSLAKVNKDNPHPEELVTDKVNKMETRKAEASAGMAPVSPTVKPTVVTPKA